MARQKSVDIVYKRVRNPRTGKAHLVKTSKIVTKATNVSKGANTGSRPWKTDAAALKSEQISANLAAQKAKIAGRVTNIAQVMQGANSISRNIAGAVKPTQSTEQVSQAVSGGLSTSQPKREEDDDEDNPYVM